MRLSAAPLPNVSGSACIAWSSSRTPWSESMAWLCTSMGSSGDCTAAFRCARLLMPRDSSAMPSVLVNRLSICVERSRTALARTSSMFRAVERRSRAALLQFCTPALLMASLPSASAPESTACAFTSASPTPPLGL